MRIKMLRNVLVDGRHCAAGEVVEVEERLAEVLVQWGRAEAAEDDGQQTTDDGGAMGKVTSEAIETATRPAGRRRSGKGEL